MLNIVEWTGWDLRLLGLGVIVPAGGLLPSFSRIALEKVSLSLGSWVLDVSIHLERGTWKRPWRGWAATRLA